MHCSQDSRCIQSLKGRVSCCSGHSVCENHLKLDSHLKSVISWNVVPKLVTSGFSSLLFLTVSCLVFFYQNALFSVFPSPQFIPGSSPSLLKVEDLLMGAVRREPCRVSCSTTVSNTVELQLGILAFRIVCEGD